MGVVQSISMASISFWISSLVSAVRSKPNESVLDKPVVLEELVLRLSVSMQRPVGRYSVSEMLETVDSGLG